MAKRPYVAQYIPKLVAQGLGTDEIHAFLNEQGFRIGKQRVDRLVGETIDLQARRETLADLPLHRKISPTEVGTATRPRARGPLVNVELAIYDKDTKEVGYHTWGVRSSDWMSPAWYIEQAINDWIDTAKLGRGTPEGTPLGGVIGGAVELVGEDNPDEEL